MNKITQLFLMMALVSAVGSMTAMEKDAKAQDQEQSDSSDDESTKTLNDKKKQSVQPEKPTKEANSDTQSKKGTFCTTAWNKVPSKKQACEKVLAFADWPLRKEDGKKPVYVFDLNPKVAHILGTSWKVVAVIGGIWLVKAIVKKCSCNRTAKTITN